MSCRKKVAFCFRPALVNNCGSIRTIRFFRACVNYFRRCHTNANVGAVGPAGKREHGAGEEYAPGTDAPPHLQSSLDHGNMRIGDRFCPVTASVRPRLTNAPVSDSKCRASWMKSRLTADASNRLWTPRAGQRRVGR